MRGKGGNIDGRSNRPRPQSVQFNQHQNGDIGMKGTKVPKNYFLIFFHNSKHRSQFNCIYLLGEK